MHPDASFLQPSELNRLQARDAASLDAEYRASRPALEAAAKRLGFGNGEAEDLIHSVWMTFIDVAPRFEGRSQVRTFLLGIMRRQASRARQRGRRTQALEPKTLEAFPASTRAHEAGELERAVQGCVGELRHAERQAVELKLLEQRDTDEVRNLLGISANYLGVLLHRARAHLRHCLADHLP